MKNNKFSTHDITLLGVFMAIVMMMAFVPELGYIKINPTLGITIIHVPVLVYILYVKGDYLKSGIIGAIFGVSSWIVALTRASSAIEAVFQNPLVSVLPRIAFALATAFLVKSIIVYKCKSCGASNEKPAAIAIIAIIGTLIHTILVLTMLWIFGKDLLGAGLVTFYGAVLGSNGLIEVVVAGIAVPVIYNVIKKIKI